MTALHELRTAADGGTNLFHDDTTPEGTFGAVIQFLGLTATYLLRGDQGDEGAEILGRIEGTSNPSAYIGNSLKGGSWFLATDSATAFAKMLARAEETHGSTSSVKSAR